MSLYLFLRFKLFLCRCERLFSTSRRTLLRCLIKYDKFCGSADYNWICDSGMESSQSILMCFGLTLFFFYSYGSQPLFRLHMNVTMFKLLNIKMIYGGLKHQYKDYLHLLLFYFCHQAALAACKKFHWQWKGTVWKGSKGFFLENLVN